MLPILQGVIDRRVLLNFRADARVVEKLVPAPFEVEQREGSAIVGVCLIRLVEIRPKGCPAWVGMTSENMAHRVAVHYQTSSGPKRGVFIWRRETNQRLVAIFGGRLFPGLHHFAKFYVEQENGGLNMKVRSADGATDVGFSASVSRDWQPTPAFRTLDDASSFLQGADCGFSCSRKKQSVEGIRLTTLQWSLMPLSVQLDKAAFYFNQSCFPKGSVEFDSGLMMRSVPHEWHQVPDCPAVTGL